MKALTILFLTSVILQLNGVYAGEVVKICRDENNNVYFTDAACLNNKKALNRVYIPDAQSGGMGALNASEKALVQSWRRGAYRHMRAEQYGSSRPTWSDRQAAKNADLSMRAERDMYRSKKGRSRYSKHGPRDAAEYAIGYNAKSVAGGGRHQVAVPDVTNVNIHGGSGRDVTIHQNHSGSSGQGSQPGGYMLKDRQSWAERTAARNAEISVRAERDLHRYRKSGPRDAAEYAIEYNAKNVAGGGTHQVRVPDVTTVNVYDRDKRHPPLINGVPATDAGGGNYIDPTTGHFLQGAAGGVIDTNTGQFLPYR